MAPEQAQGGELAPATDVYAAGTMLYELLSGRLPYPEDGDPLTTLYRHVHEDPVPLGEVMPSVPATVVDVVTRAIAREPGDRPDSAERFGLELAEAATAAWGPGWLSDRGGVAVMAAGPIVAVTERPIGGHGPVAAASSAPSTIVPPSPPPPDSPRGPAPPTIVPEPPVRPTISTHVVGLADAVAEADVVPVRQMITPPASGILFLLAAAALLALVVALALVGIGEPAHDGPATGVQINGVDPGARTVAVDFARSIDVREGTTAGAGRVSVEVGGITVTSATAADGRVDLGAARYLVAGQATLVVDSADGAATHRFAIDSSRSGWLTAPAVTAGLLVLFALAYVESSSKPLRRGRRKVVAFVQLTLSAAVFAVAVSVLLWVAGGPEPTVTGLILAAGLGAAAGATSGIGQLRFGRRRRVRRRAEGD